jgi:hypothetical protein
VFCPLLVLFCGWCFHQPLSLPLYSAVGVFTNRLKLLKLQPTTLPFIKKYNLNPFIIFGSQIKKS